MALEFYKRQFTGVLPADTEEKKKEVSEVATIYTELAYLDSIHDFWPERARVEASASDAGDDEEEPMDGKKLEMVHTALESAIRTYTNKAGGEINALLKAATGDGVTSATSNFEPKVAEYLSKKTAKLRKRESMITYQQILDSWSNTAGTDWAAYKLKIDALGDTLTINPGEISLKKMTDAQLGKIAYFLLAYLDSGSQPGTGGAGNPAFTFDGAPRDLEKILGGITQTKNAIFPQNISDSASTSFSALRGRANFYKAMPNGTKYVMKSNGFSRDKYVLSLTDDETFGPQNRLAFSLQIAKASGPAGDVKFRFGEAGNQGASVNYLSDLLIEGDRAAKPSGKVLKLTGISTVAPPTGISKVDPDLIFDLKRTGDAEQVIRAYMSGASNESRVTVVTVDRLCSVFARLIELPAIFHSSKGIYVYRGKRSVPLSPTSMLSNYQSRAKELIDIISVIGNLELIKADISKMKTHVEDGKTRAFVYSKPDPSKIPAADDEDWVTNNDAIASSFVSAMLRYRLQDISNHIDSLEKKVFVVQGITADLVAKLQTIIASNVSIIDAGTRDLKQEFLDVINGAEAIVNATGGGINQLYSPSALLKDPVYVELFNPATGRLKEGVRCSFFNFYGGPYCELQVIVGRLLREKRGRPNTASINQHIANYFRARDLAKEDFLNLEMKSKVEGWTDITNGQNIGIPPAGARSILTVIRDTVAQVGGMAGGMAGGGPADDGIGAGAGGDTAYLPMYRDLTALLRTVCDMAAGYVTVSVNRVVPATVVEMSESTIKESAAKRNTPPKGSEPEDVVIPKEPGDPNDPKSWVGWTGKGGAGEDDLVPSDTTTSAINRGNLIKNDDFRAVAGLNIGQTGDIYYAMQSCWSQSLADIKNHAEAYYGDGVKFKTDNTIGTISSYLPDEAPMVLPANVLNIIYGFYLMDVEFKKKEYEAEISWHTDGWDSNWESGWSKNWEAEWLALKPSDTPPAKASVLAPTSVVRAKAPVLVDVGRPGSFAPGGEPEASGIKRGFDEVLAGGYTRRPLYSAPKPVSFPTKTRRARRNRKTRKNK